MSSDYYRSQNRMCKITTFCKQWAIYMCVSVWHVCEDLFSVTLDTGISPREGVAAWEIFFSLWKSSWILWSAVSLTFVGGTSSWWQWMISNFFLATNSLATLVRTSNYFWTAYRGLKKWFVNHCPFVTNNRRYWTAAFCHPWMTFSCCFFHKHGTVVKYFFSSTEIDRRVNTRTEVTYNAPFNF